MSQSRLAVCTLDGVLRILTIILVLGVLTTSTAWAKPPSDVTARTLYYNGLGKLAAGKPNAALADFDRVVALLGKPNLRILPAMVKAAYLAKKYRRAAAAAAAFFDLRPSDRLAVTSRMRGLRTQISAALKVLERDKSVQAAKDREAKRKAAAIEKKRQRAQAERLKAEAARRTLVDAAWRSLVSGLPGFTSEHKWKRNKERGTTRTASKLSPIAPCRLKVKVTYHESRAGDAWLAYDETSTGTIDLENQDWGVTGALTLDYRGWFHVGVSKRSGSGWPFYVRGTHRHSSQSGADFSAEKHTGVALRTTSPTARDTMVKALKSLITVCRRR